MSEKQNQDVSLERETSLEKSRRIVSEKLQPLTAEMIKAFCDDDTDIPAYSGRLSHDG